MTTSSCSRSVPVASSKGSSLKGVLGSSIFIRVPLSKSCSAITYSSKCTWSASAWVVGCSEDFFFKIPLDLLCESNFFCSINKPFKIINQASASLQLNLRFKSLKWQKPKKT
jgi:hypothetical protein